MLQERSQNAELETKPTPSKKKTRRSFTDKQKAKVVAYAKMHGVAKAAEHFDVVQTAVRRWSKWKSTVHYYSPAVKKKVLNYLRAGHTTLAAQEKFGIHNATISVWRAKAGFAPQSKKFNQFGIRKDLPKEVQVPRLAQNLHLLARKLKEAVRKRLMEGVELEEVEIYASLLVKEILK